LNSEAKTYHTYSFKQSSDSESQDFAGTLDVEVDGSQESAANQTFFSYVLIGFLFALLF
jgi:hypothetical protein